MKRYEIFIAGWVDILDGLCTVLTLGFWNPSLSMNWCSYCTVKAARRKIKSWSKVPLDRLPTRGSF